MKRILQILLVLTGMLCTAPAVNAAFVEGLEDIPMPGGLNQVENGNLSFGNEEIRLIEVYLTSEDMSFEEVCRFYLDTLPQMGWLLKKEKKQKLLFEREGETLEISKESAKPLIVRLTVKSKP